MNLAEYISALNARQQTIHEIERVNGLLLSDPSDKTIIYLSALNDRKVLLDEKIEILKEVYACVRECVMSQPLHSERLDTFIRLTKPYMSETEQMQVESHS